MVHCCVHFVADRFVLVRLGSGADDEDERKELRQARKQDEKPKAPGEMQLVEPSPRAEQTTIGRKVIHWLNQNNIRAKKGPLADMVVEALSETSLTDPSKDQGRMWLDALSSVPDEHIFMLKLEGKNQQLKFEMKARRAMHARALNNLHASGKLTRIADLNLANSLSPARRHWLQLSLAVRLGGFVTKFIDGSREKQSKQKRAAQEEQEAAEARRLLDREAREVDEAVAKMEAAEEAALAALVKLDKEQVELENARRILQHCEEEAANTRAAVMAAEKGLMNPAGSIVLLRLAGLKNADRDGASDPMVKVFWNDECIFESQVYQNDNAPEMGEKVDIHCISSTVPDTLRCEVWDYDGIGAHEFLGQYETKGLAAEAVDDGQVAATDLLPSGAGKFPLSKSTHGHAGKFVGGFISLGQFQLYTAQAAKDLNKARRMERHATDALQEAADNAAREKKEANEQRVRLKSPPHTHTTTTHTPPPPPPPPPL